MKEIYLYEFNFIVNVIFPLVTFLGGMILNNYLIYIDRKKRIQERKRKQLEQQIKWERIAECQRTFDYEVNYERKVFMYNIYER